MSDSPILDSYSERVVNWIVSLESGQQLQKSVSILVKIFGVLTLITAIVPDVIFTFIFISDINRTPDVLAFFSVIMLILWILVDISIGTIFIGLCWNRSNKIGDLDGESHFSLLPISGVLIRLFGEGGSILFIGTGIKLSMLLILLIIPQLGRRTPDFEAVWYVFVATGGLVLGSVVLLIVTYFVAELVNLFMNMATNLKKMETQLSTKGDASAS